MRVKIERREYLRSQKGGNKWGRSGGRGELIKLREGTGRTKRTSIHSISIYLVPVSWALGRQRSTKQARTIFWNWQYNEEEREETVNR